MTDPETVIRSLTVRESEDARTQIVIVGSSGISEEMIARLCSEPANKGLVVAIDRRDLVEDPIDLLDRTMRLTAYNLKSGDRAKAGDPRQSYWQMNQAPRSARRSKRR